MAPYSYLRDKGSSLTSSAAVLVATATLMLHEAELTHAHFHVPNNSYAINVQLCYILTFILLAI